MTKLIIFDFYGTLVENGVYSPVKQVKFILDIPDEFKDYIGKFETVFMTKEHESLKQGFIAVAEAFGIDPEEQKIDACIGMWNKNTLLARPFRDAIFALTKLKEDYKIALLANTDNFSVPQIIKKYELEQYFDYMLFSSKEGMLKTNPEAIGKILAALDVKSEDAVLVGDSIDSDMRAAENAGIRGILLDRRNRRDYPDKIRNLHEIGPKLMQ